MSRQRATAQQQAGKQLPNDWKFSYAAKKDGKKKGSKKKGY